MSANSSHTPPLVDTFELYYIPALVVLGIVGNALSIYVFFRTHLRKLSSFYYLTSISVSDSVFLLSLLLVWLETAHVSLFNTPVVCEAVVYLTSLTSFLSVWLVLAFTVERFVAVKYPLLRPSVCTPARAKKTLVGLVACGCLIYVPVVFFSRAGRVDDRHVCDVDFELFELAKIFNYMDTVISFLVPVTLISVLNVWILVVVVDVTDVRRTLTQRRTLRNVAAEGGEERRTKRRAGHSMMSQNRITKMLLVVSTMFLLMSFPSYVTRIMAYLLNSGLIFMDASRFIEVQHWCIMLFYTNFGINFALYCISGQNFRKSLKSVFCKKIRQGGRTLTDSRSSSTSVASRKRKTQTTYMESQDVIPCTRSVKIKVDK